MKTMKIDATRFKLKGDKKQIGTYLADLRVTKREYKRLR